MSHGFLLKEASSLVQKDAHVILYASMKTSATMHEFFW
jgi:hypothetical protein